MDERAKVYLGAATALLLVLAAGLLAEQKTQALVWVSGTGFIALALLLLVVATPLIAKGTRHPIALKALALQRQLGICVFIFALAHIAIVEQLFLGWNVGGLLAPQAFNLLLGAVAFIILFAMAATSNDFSVKAMGKNWKRLQMLVYVAIVLVLAHFVNVGQIFAKNPLVVGVVLLFCVVGAYFRFKPKPKPKPVEKEK